MRWYLSRQVMELTVRFTCILEPKTTRLCWSCISLGFPGNLFNCILNYCEDVQYGFNSLKFNLNVLSDDMLSAFPYLVPFIYQCLITH